MGKCIGQQAMEVVHKFIVNIDREGATLEFGFYDDRNL